MKKILDFRGHSERISTIHWKNQNVFSTGSKDFTIKTYDKRVKGFVQEYANHNEEICGLQWNLKESFLASGGNDNAVYVWDHRKNNPMQYFNEHTAAVRALAWSPHNYGVLATGGGNSDKTIKFWNVNCSQSIHTIKTNSQVCNLVYSKHSNELVSTHGFSKNQIMIWNAEKKQRISVLNGHFTRVLHLAMAPDSEHIATAASDETLKFWTVFPRKKRKESKASNFSKYLMEIR